MGGVREDLARHVVPRHPRPRPGGGEGREGRASLRPAGGGQVGPGPRGAGGGGGEGGEGGGQLKPEIVSKDTEGGRDKLEFV